MADTCLALIKNAMLSVGAIGMRQTPTAHDLDYCLGKLQDVILSLPNFGTWTDVELGTDGQTYEPQAFAERIAVIGDISVTISLPQMVEATVWQLASLPNFTVLTGTYYAAPRDGARVLTYAQQGTDKAFYAYRADTGKWLSVFDLTGDSEVPLNADLHGYVEAMLSIEIAAAYGQNLLQASTVDKADKGRSVIRNRFKSDSAKPLPYAVQAIGHRCYI